jgi:hypothetical protein
MRALLPWITHLGFCGTFLNSSARGGELALQASLVEALEGGPVVIKVRMVYNGEKAKRIRVSLPWPASSIRVAGPRGWSTRNDGPGGASVYTGVQSLNPKDEAEVTVYVHHQFKDIPSGKGSLTITLPLSLEDGEQQSFSTSIDVDVPRASQENIEALRKRLLTILESKDTPHAAEEDVKNLIIGTDHVALLPLCFHLMQRPQHIHGYQDLERFVYEWSRRSANIQALLVEHLRAFGGKDDGFVFDLWKHDKVELPADQIASLLGARSLWIQALTYRNYASQCTPGTRKRLLDELAQLEDIIKMTADR